MHWKRSKSPVQGNSATSRFLNPGIFHSDAPSLILPEGELSSWGGSCVILAPRQCGHAPFPFASHSRELVSAHPPPQALSPPRPWVQALPSAARVPGLWFQGLAFCFFWVPSISFFCSLALPALCSPALHSIPRAFRNSCPLSYLGGVAELSETNQPIHKNNGDPMKQSYLKRDFLTTRFSKSRLSPNTVVCQL